MATIDELVRRWRKRADVTQEELERRTIQAGHKVSASQITHVETRRRNLSYASAEALADALGLSPEERAELHTAREVRRKAGAEMPAEIDPLEELKRGPIAMPAEIEAMRSQLVVNMERHRELKAQIDAGTADAETRVLAKHYEVEIALALSTIANYERSLIEPPAPPRRSTLHDERLMSLMSRWDHVFTEEEKTRLLQVADEIMAERQASE